MIQYRVLRAFSFINLLHRNKIATLLFSLLFSLVMCAFHVSLLSITTPRNLVQSTRSISTSLILTLVRETIDLFEKIMKLVFVTFKESLLTLNYVDNIFNSSLISLHNADRSYPNLNKLVSSANKINFSTRETLQISYIYIEWIATGPIPSPVVHHTLLLINLTKYNLV